MRRLDLFLAGDQRDSVGTHARDDLIVNFAGQQPQRQPDHAGRMRHHALDGEMGLAGIGRTENRRDTGAALFLDRRGGEEKEMVITRPLAGLSRVDGKSAAPLYHNAFEKMPSVKFLERGWNEPRPNR